MPTNEQWDKEAEILSGALERSDPTERAAYLLAACAGNEPLRRKLEALLEVEGRANEYFASASGSRTVTTPGSPGEVHPVQVGRYKIREKIGEGGCGVVYVAEQTEPVRRRVALKLIKSGMDTREVIARFEAERQALALMDHPNIARVFDGGATENGRPYFVMELVRGLPITAFCDQAQLDTRARLDLFVKVCQAMQHAHQKGIIHRDIKPSNILVTLHDGVAVPKVIDFGIAKATEVRLTDATVYTQLHHFIGTPAYMSPEQAELSGLDIDTRSDIYSLGVLLYQLLTGRTPFVGKELLAMGLDAMRQVIREKEPARPSTALATLQRQELTTVARHRRVDAVKLIHLVSGDLDWIVMKCLEKDRTRRYESASGLAADLGRHLANEAVLARPPSAAYRARKAIRRNRLAFAAIVAIAVALVVGLTLSTMGLRRAVASQRETEAARRNELTQRERAEQISQESRRNQYAAEMSLAAATLGPGPAGSSQGDFANTRRLLAHWTKTNGVDLRDFAWRYLWKKSRGEKHRSVVVSDQLVGGLGVSPDRRMAITEDALGALSFWDAATLTRVGFYTNWTRHAGWSDETGEMRVGNAAGEFGFLNPTNGTFRRDPASDGFEKIWDHQSDYSFAGNDLLVIRSDPPTWWQILNGALVPVSPESAKPEPAISGPGNGWVLRSIWGDVSYWGRSGSNNLGPWERLIWDQTTRREVSHFQFSKPTGAEINGDEILVIATKGLSPEIFIKNLVNGREFRFPSGHPGSIGFSISKNLKWLASSGDDATLRVWSTETGLLQGVFHGHETAIGDMHFVDEDRAVAILGADRRLRVWYWRDSNPKDWQTQVHFARERKSLAFSADGRWMAATTNETCLIWNAHSLDVAMTVPACLRPLQFDPSGRFLYLLHTNRVAQWDLISPQPREVAHLDQRDFLRESTTNLFFNDGRILTYVNHAEVYRKAFAFDPDGHLLVSRGLDGQVEATEFPSGRRVFATIGARPRRGDPTYPEIRFTPDARQLVAFEPAGANCRMVFWDLSGNKSLGPIFQSEQALAIEFSNDGRLAAATFQGEASIHLIDWQSRTELGRLHGHRIHARGLSFSPDGRTLASGSSDGTVRLWSVASRQLLATLTFDEEGSQPDVDGRVYQVFFSPDGNSLAALSASGRVRLFQAPSLAEIDAMEAGGDATR